MIDTYDTIAAAKLVAQFKKPVSAVRIDSGDLLALSKEVREILDKNGMRDAKIIASGSLDEYEICDLLRKKAPVDIFGVGTEMATSSDAPALDMVYKLVQVETPQGLVKYKTKGSVGKTYFPSRKQVFRQMTARENFIRDVVSQAGEKNPEYSQALLEPVIQNGRLVKKFPDIKKIQAYARERVARLPSNCRRLRGGKGLRVDLSRQLKTVQKEFERHAFRGGGKKALLVVDVQNDFCPGGALAVKKGDEVVPVLNQYIRFFKERGYPVFASRDWHPHRTKHFKEFGGNWPVHCIQKTRGARFHPSLNLPKNAVILSKGQDPKKDGYSAFEGLGMKGKTFVEEIVSCNVKELYVGGLATEYCVKNSVLDSMKHGIKTYLLTDAIRGVDPKTAQQAAREMKKKGASAIFFEKLSAQALPSF